MDESIYISDSKSLTTLGNLILEDSNFSESIKLISSVLLESNLSLDNKIYIFNRKSNLFNREFINEFLTSLGGNFKELNEKGPMPYFEKSDLLFNFFKYLKQEGKISKIKPKKDLIQVTTFRK